MIEPRNKAKRKKILLLAYVVFLLILLFSGLLLSPLFKVKIVEVSGAKEINPDEIRANVEHKNLLFITVSGLKKDLAEKFPQIAQMNIEKKLFEKTIIISLTEREKLGIVCKAVTNENNEENIGECFYIDKTGTIFKNAPQTSGSLVLLIKDFSLEEFSLGKEMFSPQAMNAITDLRDNLYAQTGAKPLWFAFLTYPPQEIKLMTSEGWYVFFDLSRDAKNQLSILKTALTEKIPDRTKLEYIDLRIEGRIYYK